MPMSPVARRQRRLRTIGNRRMLTIAALDSATASTSVLDWHACGNAEMTFTEVYEAPAIAPVVPTIEPPRLKAAPDPNYSPGPGTVWGLAAPVTWQEFLAANSPGTNQLNGQLRAPLVWRTRSLQGGTPGPADGSMPSPMPMPAYSPGPATIADAMDYSSHDMHAGEAMACSQESMHVGQVFEQELPIIPSRRVLAARRKLREDPHTLQKLREHRAQPFWKSVKNSFLHPVRLASTPDNPDPRVDHREHARILQQKGIGRKAAVSRRQLPHMAEASPQPAPVVSPGCSDTCKYPRDGLCDDGGVGSQYSDCDPGTDCTDCGVRATPEQEMASVFASAVPSPAPTGTDDGTADTLPVPTYTIMELDPSPSPGPVAPIVPSPTPTPMPYMAGVPTPTPVPTPAAATPYICSNTCMYPSDNLCDDGGAASAYNICATGTDCADCGMRYTAAYTPLPPAVSPSSPPSPGFPPPPPSSPPNSPSTPPIGAFTSPAPPSWVEPGSGDPIFHQPVPTPTPAPSALNGKAFLIVPNTPPGVDPTTIGATPPSFAVNFEHSHPHAREMSVDEGRALRRRRLAEVNLSEEDDSSDLHFDECVVFHCFVGDDDCEEPSDISACMRFDEDGVCIDPLCRYTDGALEIPYQMAEPPQATGEPASDQPRDPLAP